MEPVTLEIDNGGEVLLFEGKETDKIAVLAFHGGGGVDGTPAMLTPFVQTLVTGGGMAVVSARYRTLNKDNAGFDDMRADAANALAWAAGQIPADSALYLLGASFGGLLALDALLESAPATQARIKGLILLNPVTDLSEANGWSNRVVTPSAHSHLSPVARLAGHPILENLTCYIAHGGQDDVVPIKASRRFATLWPEGKVAVAEYRNSSHGFFNRAPHDATVANAIRQFLGLSVDGVVVPKVKTKPEPIAPTKAPSPSAKTANGFLPAGATVVYGIGAQKAGTSWLYEHLTQSDECHTVPTKEMHYFDALYIKGEESHIKTRHEQINRIVPTITMGVDPKNLQRLEKLQLVADRLSIHATKRGDHGPYVNYMLKGYAHQKIMCDFTPSYCTLDTAGFSEMNSIGQAKFIFLMRDPVERMWSQMRMAVSAANPKLADAEYEAKCIARARDFCATRDLAKIPRADYARTMEQLEAAVPADQILYVFYEELFTQASMDKICGFLGIDPVAVKPNEKVNLGRTSSLPADVAALMAQSLEPQYAAARARFGSTLPDSWRQSTGTTTSSGNTKTTAPQLTTSARSIPAAAVSKLPFLSKLRRYGNLAQTAPVVVFPHIPKTAGQTVIKELMRAIPKSQVSPVRTHATAPADAQMPAGYRLYAGHIDWVDLETLSEDRFAFTILRDPRERIASFYFYLIREAGKLSAKNLASKERTNMRMVSTLSADEYFFGGDQPWQRFIQDHYNNFYCNYLITRKIRGWKDVSKLDQQTLVTRAVEGAGALQQIYSTSTLDKFEQDMSTVLGITVRAQGNYVNAGPDAQNANRWNDLVALFEDDANVARLEQFADADSELMTRLNLPL